MLQVEVYDVSCPESTPATAPVEIEQITDPSTTVQRVVVRVPAGHSGLTGFALAYGHQPVIPRNTGAFLSGDDDTFPFDLTGYPAGVPWSVFLCNLDLQAHVWQITWEMQTVDNGSIVASPASLSPAEIIGAVA